MCPMCLIPYGNTRTWWNRNAKYSVGQSKDIIRFQPRLCFSELCCDGNMEAFCSFFFFKSWQWEVRLSSGPWVGFLPLCASYTSQKERTFLLSGCINFPWIGVKLVRRSQIGDWKSGPSSLSPKSQLTLGRLLPTSGLQRHLYFFFLFLFFFTQPMRRTGPHSSLPD